MTTMPKWSIATSSSAGFWPDEGQCRAAQPYAVGAEKPFSRRVPPGVFEVVENEIA
ncbi:hypothetical protein ABZV14_32155 [Streptosporangium canum]|uniref:hypothetical protein n=1 Tax=Streptosporangium canum TaxID=324952 RepID=UPI0033B95844